MMRDNEDVDASQQVLRTHEEHLLIPGEISQIKNLEFSKVDEDTQRMRVFAAVHRLVLRNFAVFVFCSASGQRMIDDVAVAADDGNFHAGYRNHITRLGNDVLMFSGRQDLLIGIPHFKCRSAGFGIDVYPMVDESSDRDAIDQLGYSARMIVVIVSEQHVIDLLDAREFRSSQYSICIATSIVRPAGIDQQRLPCRRDKECRLAALDIHKVNSKVVFSSPGMRRTDCEGKEKGISK